MKLQLGQVGSQTLAFSTSKSKENEVIRWDKAMEPKSWSSSISHHFTSPTWIMCGLEGPCFSTQILVDILKFLVKYGLFNHVYMI